MGLNNASGNLLNVRGEGKHRTCALMDSHHWTPWRQGIMSVPAGRVAEWSIATVLKTVEPRGSVGSNPTPSATKI